MCDTIASVTGHLLFPWKYHADMKASHEYDTLKIPGCNLPGVSQKKNTFFKALYLRPLISLRKSSVLEMHL